MEQKQYLGAKIKEFRKERLGISAERLGQMLEHPVSRPTIHSWESGRTEPTAGITPLLRTYVIT